MQVIIVSLHFLLSSENQKEQEERCRRQVNATTGEGQRMRFFNEEGQQAGDFARE
jgi:hypothetical protein